MTRINRPSIIPALLLFAVLALVRGPVQAAEDRIWIEFDGASPTAVDFAHFVQDYVHKDLYRDKYPQAADRFYVQGLKSIGLVGNQAEVAFFVLDTKTNVTLADTMLFERGEDGAWYFLTARGEKLKVFTPVRKWAYYYRAYVTPVAWSGLILSSGFGIFYFLRRRKQNTSSPTG